MSEIPKLISSDAGMYYLLATLDHKAFVEYADSLGPEHPNKTLVDKIVVDMTFPARVDSEEEKGEKR